MNNIDEIKNRLDIVDVISESVKLRRSGKNYTGFCPFHANTRTPAFVVFPDTGTWRCFGECNEGGDIFRFVMKKEGIDFKEALKMLANRAGIQLEPLTPQKIERNERADLLRKILEEAVVFYRHQLLKTDEGLKARSYLQEKRGIKPGTEEAWGLGYAPNSWDAVLNHFKRKGYTVRDIIDAGLLTEKDDGKVYDRFRHRLMIPIREMSGKIAGFGGRVLNPNDVPKFINSPQSILFNKSAIMFGLDKARKAIRSANQAVIVEGYFDVIVPHQEGFENLVSPMGTALAETQMRLLKRFTRRFVMALDPDAAGQKATIRGLEVARGALDHEGDLVFNARGLLHYESRLKADLRVSTLPDNLDPDEIVLRNHDEWKTIIENAQPIIYHVLETLVEGQDIDDPRVKSTIASQVLPLVKDIASPIERDAYRQYIARTLKVDERSLMETSVSNPIKRRKKQKIKGQPSINPPLQAARTSEQENINRIEKEILAFLSIEPEHKYKIDRFLRSNDLSQISLNDFKHTENTEIARIIFDSLSQDKQDPIDYINVHVDLSNFTTEFSHPPLPEDNEKKENAKIRKLEEAARLVMQVRQINTNQEIKELRFLQTDRIDQGNDKSVDKTLQIHMVELIKKRGLLDRALAKPVSID